MKPYEKDTTKKEQVTEMFDRIAPAYDKLNHMLSFNMDRLWRRRMVRMASAAAPRSIIDIATGTGDLAVALARRNPAAAVTGVDISPEMVRYGQEKMRRKGLDDRVTLEVGDAERLRFGDGGFDTAAVSFGIRNFGDIAAGLGEMFRVLRPGGEVFIMEFSVPSWWLFRKVYRFYFHRILPLVGGLVSRDREAYKYLPASVDEFPDKALFLRMMSEAGFTDNSARALMNGIAYIYKGKKQ